MNPLLSALTASGIITADVAAMVDRQMSPIDAQLYAERVMSDAFASGLKAQEIRYLDLVNAANGKPPEQQLAMFWEDENAALYRSVEGALVQVASDRAVQISIATGNADMWNVVNEEIVDWVGEYYQSFDPSFVGSIPNLNVTARTLIGQVFNDWQRGEIEGFGAADGLPQLIRALEPTFGVKRATTIAVTETTRVFNEATIAAGRANPLITRYRFFSAADDRVCPICGPLHNSISSPNKTNPTFNHPSLGALPIPPLHVNCRCQAVPETDVTLQFDSDLPRPYTWSPETPAEYAKRRRNELAKTRPPTPKPPKAQPPEATLPPKATEPVKAPEWQPAMSRAQADLWAKDSTYKEEVYHVTTAESAQGIRDTGFDLGRQNFGRMWGDGVYVGADLNTADRYIEWVASTGSQVQNLKIKLNVQNLAVFDAGGTSSFTQGDILESVLDVDAATVRKLTRGESDLSAVLHKQGFDALHIHNAGAVAGGNQIVVFDPKKVVVIDD